MKRLSLDTGHLTDEELGIDRDLNAQMKETTPQNYEWRGPYGDCALCQTGRIHSHPVRESHNPFSTPDLDRIVEL